MNFVRNITRQFGDKPKLIILMTEIFLLVLHYSFSISNTFFALRFILGLVSYIFIPGFVFVSAFSFFSNRDICLDLLFGLIFPILTISVIWSLHIEKINLNLILAVFMVLFISILLFFSTSESLSRFNKTYLKKSHLFIILLFLIFGFIYFSSNSSSMAIDGGLYADVARTITSSGEFSSKILNSDQTNPYFNVEGYLNYPLTVFSISLFFLIGDVSFVSVKLFTLFVGLLLVLVIYKISKDLFGKETALLSGLIASFFPLLSYYSSILHGPEILSALFVMASLYFFLQGINSDSNLLPMAFSGLFAALAFGAWGLIPFFTLLGCSFLIFMLYTFNFGKGVVLHSILLFGVIFCTYKFSTIPALELILILVSVTFFFFCWKHGKLLSLKFSVFTVVICFSLQLFFLHSYLATQPYITGMEHVIVPLEETLKNEPIKALNPFFLPTGIHFDIDYVVNSLSRFWESLATVLGPFLFGLFVAAFINPKKLKEKIVLILFPCVCSLIYVLTFGEALFWYGTILDDRFLILPVCFSIILSSASIIVLLNAKKTFTISFSFINRVFNLHLSKFRIKQIFFGVACLIIIFSLIPLHFHYLEKLDTGYTNVRSWYGEAPLSWIETSTQSGEIFCATDSNRLAFFTNRSFVGIDESEELDISEMISLINEFKIDYLIIDNFFVSYTVHSDFFNDLYENSFDFGQVIPILESDVTDNLVGSLVQSKNNSVVNDFYGLQLVFDYSEDSRLFRVFQVLNASFSMNLKFMDDAFIEGWCSERGTFNITEDGAKISTKISNDWAYICLNSSQCFPSSFENAFLTLRLCGSDNSTNFWVALVDSNGTWYKIQNDVSLSTNFEEYTYNLEGFIDKNITNIYLGVSGANETSVTYDWIAIYDLLIN